YDNNYRYAALIVKYDYDGNYVWSARSEGDGQNCTASEVKVDNLGNVVVGGSFTGPAIFGAAHFTNSTGKSNAFIAKLGPRGDYLQAAQVTGNAGVSGSSVALTSNGDCEIAGTFSDSVAAGPYSGRGAGGLDMFLAKFSLTGLSVDTFVPAPKGELFLYPNPAGDIVRLIGRRSTDPVHIYSTDGALVMDFGPADRIDISHLPVGTYFVKSGDLVCTLMKVGAGGNP
ncbi:MAG: T9SS type A sorting domain-containing protein, partial [Bacteroidota bacterium]